MFGSIVRRFVPILAALPLLAAGCRGQRDVDDLRAMMLTAVALPPSPTNAVVDDPAAVALGRALFFDKNLSVDGSIACASCHRAEAGFSDPRAFSVGVRGQLGGRHAMPITAVAFQRFTLWDGRGDSVWAQPLMAIENEKEMDLTRIELLRRVATHYRPHYESIFGALPSTQGLPERGKPGMAAWDALPGKTRDAINRVGASVGKAIEPFERTIPSEDKRFDRWAAGTEALTDRELRGARVFVENGCDNCHSGPAFSDGEFHNIGIPSTDPGRAEGLEQLLAGDFNGAGIHSDNPAVGLARLQAVSQEEGTLGAFRTASLRGVGQRTFFGHASHEKTLRGCIDDVYHRGGGRGRRRASIGTLDSLMNRVNVGGNELDDLVAFLHTLDCPPSTAAAAAPK